MGKKPKGPVAAALEAKKAMTPETGYNVVGVDTFEPPGEELFLVGHYDTWEEAEAVRKARASTTPGTAASSGSGAGTTAASCC